MSVGTSATDSTARIHLSMADGANMIDLPPPPQYTPIEAPNKECTHCGGEIAPVLRTRNFVNYKFPHPKFWVHVDNLSQQCPCRFLATPPKEE